MTTRLSATAASIALLAGVAWPQAAEAVTFHNVPVVVNNLKNSGASKGHVEEAIKEANKVLKKARIKLTAVEFNEGVSDSNNDDAKLTQSEREKLLKEGAKEIKESPKKTGIKIYVAKSVDTANDSTVGLARHRDPTMFIEQQVSGILGKPDPKKTGETIAHELGHMLTLGGGHAVTDTVNADENGHTNPNLKGSAHRGNLMAPSGRGTALTDKQIEEMTRKGGMIDRVSVAVKKQKSGTGEPTKAQNGSAVDDDATPPPATPSADLSRAVMTATADDQEANLFLSLGGLFPTLGAFEQDFSVGFDVDASAATGVALTEFGATGFDAFLDFSVSRTGAGDETPVAQASLRDAVSGATLGGVDAKVVVGTDFDVGPTGDGSEPAENQLTIDFSKVDAGFQGPLVGVGAIAFNVNGEIVDTLATEFDLNFWKSQPTLDIGLGMPRPGQSVPFDIAGLAPGSLFELFFNDDLLMSATLDGLGGFSGTFAMPDFSNGTHFVTAQDETGNYAFNIVMPTPLPAGGVLGLSAILIGWAAGRFAKRRSE